MVVELEFTMFERRRAHVHVIAGQCHQFIGKPLITLLCVENLQNIICPPVFRGGK